MRQPSGYDITKIVTFAGHSDGRASQNYSVSVAFVSAPATFAVLVPSAAVDCVGGSSEVVIVNPQGGPLTHDISVRAVGVAALRFDFQDGPLGFNVYREIQVLGQAAAK